MFSGIYFALCVGILVALPTLALAGWTVEDGATANGRDVFTYTYDFAGEPMLEVEDGSIVIDLGMVGTDVQIIAADFEGIVYENFVHTEQETCVGCVDNAPIMNFTIHGANTLSLNVFENGYGGPFAGTASYTSEFASSTEPLQVILTYYYQSQPDQITVPLRPNAFKN